MKKTKLSIVICLLLLVSMLSPSVLAAEIESPPDGPIDPEPYTYISSISINFTISNSGRADCYASAFVPDDTKTVDVIVRLQRRPLTSTSSSDWVTIGGPWTNSGSYRVTVDQPQYVLRGYTYRILVGVNVYDGDILCEAEPAQSDYINFYS